MKLTACFIVLCALACATNISAGNDFTVRSGDIKLKLLRNGDLYKASPLFPRQEWISKYQKKRLHKDWSGQYYAFKKDVSKGYGQDYLVGGKGGFFLKMFRIKSQFYVLKLTNRKFADGSITQEEKARKLKQFFKDNGLGKVEDQKIPRNNPGLLDKFNDISSKLRNEFKVVTVSLIKTLSNIDVALESPLESIDTELIIPPNVDNKLEEKKSEVIVYVHPDEIKTYPTFSDEVKRIKVIQDQKTAAEREPLTIVE